MGRTGGGVFNTTLKSGSNTLHGVLQGGPVPAADQVAVDVVDLVGHLVEDLVLHGRHQHPVDGRVAGGEDLHRLFGGTTPRRAERVAPVGEPGAVGRWEVDTDELGDDHVGVVLGDEAAHLAQPVPPRRHPAERVEPLQEARAGHGAAEHLEPLGVERFGDERRRLVGE